MHSHWCRPITFGLYAVLLVGCAREKQLNDAAVTLRPGEWSRLQMVGERIREGKTEVCVKVPEGHRLGATLDSLRNAAGTPLELSARLVDSASAKIEFSGRSQVSGGADQEFCFTDPQAPIGTTLTAVELSASDTVVIQHIWWWSGRRAVGLP